MTFKFSSKDHHKLTALVEGMIAAVETDQALRMQASEALCHIITAAAEGNESEVRSWLEPERLIAWQKACDDVRKTLNA